jgi:hypothetical protein
MDGRTDLSIMQLSTGSRPKSYFDKEMDYFVPNKSQLPDLVSRGKKEPMLIVDRLLTIQNVYRDAASYTPSDHIRREMSNNMEGSPLTPLSRKTMYTIYKANNPKIEQEIIQGVLASNRIMKGQDPNAQWENTLRRSDMIKNADQVLEMIEEKII